MLLTALLQGLTLAGHLPEPPPLLTMVMMPVSFRWGRGQCQVYPLQGGDKGERGEEAGAQTEGGRAKVPLQD